jgi:hypothetical protein
LFGAWASSLVASAVPNSQLARFAPALQAGRILMMVDVPMRSIGEVSELVRRRHPEAVAGGFEPTLVFP